MPCWPADGGGKRLPGVVRAARVKKSISRSGGRVLVLLFLAATVAVSAQSVPPELFNGLKWRLIGPFRGGRVVAVAGVPGDSTTFYFGGVDGGVWKTTDAGVVWKPIFDGQPVASIGALAVAPSSPDVVYVGTGESTLRDSMGFSHRDVFVTTKSGPK